MDVNVSEIRFDLYIWHILISSKYIQLIIQTRTLLRVKGVSINNYTGTTGITSIAMDKPEHMVTQLIILCDHLMQFIHLTLFVKCLPCVALGIQCLTWAYNV